MTVHRPPQHLLLLYSDHSDPVSSAILDHPDQFGCEVIAVSLAQLANELVPGAQWNCAGRSIDPATTAVINRLTSFGAEEPGSPLATYFQQQQLWSFLSVELRRFAYASALPTPSSIIGSYGSLLDQWLDLPQMVGGLRVPAHQTPWGREELRGDVYAVNPFNLYSLGRAISAGPQPNAATAAEVAFVRPPGWLVHVAQVGRTILFANAPPGMTPQQQNYINAFVAAMAAVSTSRILEHAFFVGNELPVFYSTCPVPVITGKLPAYSNLIVQGLQDDFHHLDRRAA